MKVFISFDIDDLAQVNGFRGMLENPNLDELSGTDHSVKEDLGGEPRKEIQAAILTKIRTASVCVCLISHKTRNSKWVNWELEQCRLAGKGIVGVVLKEHQVATLAGCPEFFSRYPKYKVVGWGTPAHIQVAIRAAISNA